MKYLKEYKNFESYNPALKIEIENYIDNLIEKDYNKLLSILNIKKQAREIDIDELKEKAIKYFIEEPERMSILNIAPHYITKGNNIIPHINNIGGYLRE